MDSNSDTDCMKRSRCISSVRKLVDRVQRRLAGEEGFSLIELTIVLTGSGAAGTATLHSRDCAPCSHRNTDPVPHGTLSPPLQEYTLAVGREAPDGAGHETGKGNQMIATQNIARHMSRQVGSSWLAITVRTASPS